MARIPVFDVLKHFLHPGPLKPPPSAHDQKLLDCFREVVERHKSDPEFTTAVAAARVGLSQMHLNRELRALTGRSTHEYFQEMRLEEARTLLS
jgi:transcriptional regulator GlxA family with amidase domain